jgi:hypothetical protein
MPVDLQQDWLSAHRTFSDAVLLPDAPKPTGILGGVKRFNVYRNNVTVGLVRALEANFPALRRLLGDDFFASMAVDFIRQHPPQSRVMFEYGEELSGFISNAEPLQRYPYLTDVARWEWTWLQVFHEADAPVLKGEDLQSAIAQDPDAVTLAPHPALRLLRSDFAFHTIAETSRAARPLDGVNPAAPEFCLMTRPEFAVLAQPVTQSQFEFIGQLANGVTIADAVDRAFANPGFDVTQAMALVLASGAFSSANLNKEA